MRFIKSFILRLYKDSDEPDLLCGNLQIPSSQEIFSFKSEAALIKLLHQLVYSLQKTPIQIKGRRIHENKSID